MILNVHDLFVSDNPPSSALSATPTRKDVTTVIENERASPRPSSSSSTGDQTVALLMSSCKPQNCTLICLDINIILTILRLI